MFQENFLQLLQKSKMTPYRVAKATGISQGLISDYKNGKKSPSSQNLKKLADFFGCTVDDLLGDTHKKTNPANDDEAWFNALAPHEQELITYIRSQPKESQPAACQDAEAFLRFRSEKR
mgnify:CR=1 FL=1